MLDHGQFILGPEVTELEEAIAAFSGVAHGIGVSSGRDALIMALMALGVGPGDAVIVPAFTFSATAAVVSSVGATPVFVDVDATTYNMDPHAIAPAIESARTRGLTVKAVMPVDLFGLPADYAAIAKVTDAYGIRIIADAAQSFGGRVGEARVGSLAPISCVSFYPTKPLGAFGDGGGILTDDDELAETVRQIRTHGRQGDGDEAMRIGMTGRLDTMQAAILLAKLSVFKAELNRRAEIAALYNTLLDGVCTLPPADGVARSAYALYTVRMKDRDRRPRGAGRPPDRRRPLLPRAAPQAPGLRRHAGRRRAARRCRDAVARSPQPADGPGHHRRRGPHGGRHAGGIRPRQGRTARRSLTDRLSRRAERVTLRPRGHPRPRLPGDP